MDVDPLPGVEAVLEAPTLAELEAEDVPLIVPALLVLGCGSCVLLEVPDPYVLVPGCEELELAPLEGVAVLELVVERASPVAVPLEVPDALLVEDVCACSARTAAKSADVPHASHFAFGFMSTLWLRFRRSSAHLRTSPGRRWAC